MTEDVYITVTGRHRTGDEEQEPVTYSTRGKYFQRNGKHFLIYEESLEGAAEATKNTVKFGEGMLRVAKKAASESVMLFEEGARRSSVYHTSQGDLLMEIETSRVEIQDNQTKLEVVAEYGLYFGEDKVQDSSVVISCVPYPFI